MNYETYIKEGHYHKTLIKVNKLTKEERISKEKTLKIFLTDTFSILYLYGYPP